MPDLGRVYADDRRGLAEVDRLLAAEGIRRDAHLDYTCGLYDDDGSLIATGSCFGSTLRCLAVDHRRQGEGLLGTLVSHLLDVQGERGNTGDVFLYTKPESARYFRDLGFQEVARVEGLLVLMEHPRDRLGDCLARFREEAGGRITGTGAGAIVMNANPFTLGHQRLVEAAARQCPLVHVFVVSEDASLFPFAVRHRLVLEGTAHLPNVVVHAGGPYIVSGATFPSYFLKDSDEASRGHARLDAAIFARIAAALSISRRYVGTEPASHVTAIYNDVLSEELPRAGLECVVMPRFTVDGEPVSASTVRSLLRSAGRALDLGKSLVARLVPEATLRFLRSESAAPVLERIRRAASVVHH